MRHKVVSTFNPSMPRFRGNRYNSLYNSFKQKGLEVSILPHPEIKKLDFLLEQYKENLNEADAIFHFSDYFTRWTEGFFDNNHKHYNSLKEHPEKKIRTEFKEELNKHIEQLIDSKTVVEANCFFGDGRIIDSIHQIGIPAVDSKTVEEWESKKIFPSVFKMENTSGGEGIYFVETEEQFRKLFDIEYEISRKAKERLKKQASHNNFTDKKNNFSVSNFIDCPSKNYTHYRIMTLGSGEILGSVLSYSIHTKSDDERIALDDANISNVYDDIKSPFFLNRKKIVSNKQGGGIQISLNPTSESRKITNYEANLLSEHGLVNQQLPSILEKQAISVAKILGKQGMYHVGQDWIQNLDGKFYFLEANSIPGLDIFDTLYNFGFDKSEKTEIIAADRISNGVINHIIKNKN